MKQIEILDKFSENNILVIGDVMLDQYKDCLVTRISPEAPIQVADIQKESYKPGGAGNSANNIAALNSKVHLLGVVGSDYFGKIIKKELEKRKVNVQGVIEEEGRPTTRKQRVIAHGQQLLRMDHESRDEITAETEKKMIQYVKDNIKEFKAIIISDYAKGVITENLVQETIKLANSAGIPVVIDTRPKNKRFYKHATLITPNEGEARQMVGSDKMKISEVGDTLIKDLDTNVLITRGEKGMALFKKDGTTKSFPTVAKEVYDVSGAGDTATATLTLSIASGSTMEEAVELANIAAGIVVGKAGTATTTMEEIKNVIKDRC